MDETAEGGSGTCGIGIGEAEEDDIHEDGAISEETDSDVAEEAAEDADEDDSDVDDEDEDEEAAEEDDAYDNTADDEADDACPPFSRLSRACTNAAGG